MSQTQSNSNQTHLPTPNPSRARAMCGGAILADLIPSPRSGGHTKKNKRRRISDDEDFEAAFEEFDAGDSDSDSDSESEEVDEYDVVVDDDDSEDGVVVLPPPPPPPPIPMEFWGNLLLYLSLFPSLSPSIYIAQFRFLFDLIWTRFV